MTGKARARKAGYVERYQHHKDSLLSNTKQVYYQLIS